MTINIIEEYANKRNIAESLEDEKLNEIASVCLNGFSDDISSRSDWENQYEEWVKLAAQIKEDKSFPWDGASNVKYPLVSTAAMQFSARAYPALVPNKKVVSFGTTGRDPEEKKYKRATRLQTHMSYQILHEMEKWEEGMDKLLYSIPIVGCMFKKTYYDPTKNRNCSKIIYPRDLVVNYWATSLEDAYRKTEILYLTKNELQERKNHGLYVEDYDPKLTCFSSYTTLKEKAMSNYGNNSPTKEDDSTTYAILEMHTYYDLDDDGYAEPYIITIDPSQQKVIRITAGYYAEDVEANGDKILSIKQCQYYTKFPFLPSPDGGFYDYGFGALLGPLNETINTLINQIIDSGTLYNLQAGYLLKGSRMKGGDQPFQLGEWKQLNVPTDDIRKAVMPLPAREPSGVLFQLLGTVIESGQQLASVAEIFVGKMPGQNTPATTTMATIEQGMKVFTSIYKRVYRALTEEFRKLYKLNKRYLTSDVYVQILDDPELQVVTITDYQEDDSDVYPAADPDSATDVEKLMQAQAIMQLVPMGTIDPKWATKKMADALKIYDIDEGMNYQPPPNPEQQKMQMEAQLKQQEAEAKAQAKAAELQMKMQAQLFDTQLRSAEAEQKLQLDLIKLQSQAREAELTLKMKTMENALALYQKENEHAQKMRQNEETHKNKMKELGDKEKQLASRKKKTRITPQKDGSYSIEDEEESAPKKTKKTLREGPDGSFELEIE